MKKIVVTLLAGVMALGLVACGASSDSAAESKVPANTVNSVDDLPGKTIGILILQQMIDYLFLFQLLYL